jgi:putative GTP pyrophosphokinase
LQNHAAKRVKAILAVFDTRKDVFAKFTSEIERLLVELLPRRDVHKIEPRVKERDSLEEKLFRPQKPYSQLEDITDICGLRIITYFADAVPKVFKIIKKEFHVEDPSDKVDLLNPDQFGYLSFHCIITLPRRRTRTTENKAFIGLTAEIQIRSILQHAWAEIEHDLGYKSTHAIPRRVRRPFSRLAGLLELGDSEFIRIRNELEALDREIAREISDSPAALSVDKNSVAAFIKNSSIISRIENHVSEVVHLRLVFSDDFVEAYVARLAFLRINTIGEAERQLIKRVKVVTKFLIAWFRGAGDGRLNFIPKGISISFLCWAVALEKGGLPALTDFLTKHAFSKNQDIGKLASGMNDAYLKLKVSQRSPQGRRQLESKKVTG